MCNTNVYGYSSHQTAVLRSIKKWGFHLQQRAEKIRTAIHAPLTIHYNHKATELLYWKKDSVSNELNDLSNKTSTIKLLSIICIMQKKTFTWLPDGNTLLPSSYQWNFSVHYAVYIDTTCMNPLLTLKSIDYQNC